MIEPSVKQLFSNNIFSLFSSEKIVKTIVSHHKWRNLKLGVKEANRKYTLKVEMLREHWVMVVAGVPVLSRYFDL